MKPSTLFAGVIAGVAVAGALLMIEYADEIGTKEQKALRKIKSPDAWVKISKSLKKQFKDLKEADLKLEYGNEKEIFDRLAEKLKMSKDEVVAMINLT